MEQYFDDIFFPEELSLDTHEPNLEELNTLRKKVNLVNQLVNNAYSVLKGRFEAIISLGDFSERPSDGGTLLPFSSYGIYYILPYTPNNQLKKENRQPLIPIRKMILDFKNCVPGSIEMGAVFLFLGILELSYAIPQKKIALVGIPSSSCGKRSPVCESIPYIVSLADKLSEYIIELQWSLVLLDYSSCLTRKYSITPSHLAKYNGKTVSLADKLFSLKYVEKEKSDDNIAYVILDDVTTSGDSMNAAALMLRINGINTQNIYQLSLSHTLKYDD